MLEGIFMLLNVDDRNILIAERNEFKTPRPPFKPRREHITSLSVDLTIGGSQIANSFSSPANYETHTDYRRKNEDMIYTPSYNLNLRYAIDKFSFTTGINYFVFGEKINYLFENLKYDTIPFKVNIEDVYWTYDSAGIYQDPYNSDIWYVLYKPTSHDTTYSVWTEKDTIIKTTNAQKNRNTYSYFEVPVLVGYNFSHKRFNFELSTGVSFGFLSKTSGYVLNTNNESLIENSDKNLPLNKTTLNYLLVGGISYNLTQRLSIILQPHYKKQLSSVFGNSYPIEQKYSAFGVNGGIRYLIK